MAHDPMICAADSNNLKVSNFLLVSRIVGARSLKQIEKKLNAEKWIFPYGCECL